MLKAFKEFAFKGNVVDLAVAVVIGAAFGAIIASFVNDLINPIIGLILGRTDLSNLYVVLHAGKTPPPYASLAAARGVGASVLAYGAFLNAVINFLIIAAALFIVIEVVARRFRKTEEATEKDCPYCLTSIPKGATKCPSCTSELAPEQPLQTA